MEDEFVAQQRAAHLDFEGPAPVYARIHFRFEEAVPVAAFTLGSVQREVGDAQKLLSVHAIVRRDRNAYTGAERNLGAVDGEWRADRFDDARRQGRGARRLANVGLQDREFVAAKPRERILGAAYAGAQTLAHALQQRVAVRMAKRVVYGLETIQVDAEHREGAVMPAAIVEGPLELLAEHAAVDEIGERVMTRHVRDARFGSPASDLAVDAGKRDGEVDRLRNVIVGSHSERFDDVFGLALRGDHDNRQKRRREFLTDTPQDFGSVDARHHHVQQHAVERLLLDKPQSLGAAVRLDDLEASSLEATRQHRPIVGEIVDDEQSSRRESAFIRIRLSEVGTTVIGRPPACLRRSPGRRPCRREFPRRGAP